ncbi:hypothetical protein [Parasphingorhabdus sp.]|uniref:hypothetical protein n=1 Tax=Parasphingorhabdus sp. TaxID=2709688 RepID=UPI003BAE783A
MTRIDRLEQAISNLAANADEQHAYLESILAPVSGYNDGRGYGNDELGLEFDDIFIAVDDVVHCSELSKDQLQATRLLDEHLGQLWGEQNADFWARDALWHDPRWQVVRDLAKKAKKVFQKNQKTR